MAYLFLYRSKSINIVVFEIIFLTSDRSSIIWLISAGHASKSVRVLSVPVFTGHWQPFEVRVEDGEVGVVFFQDPNCRPLYRKLAYGVTSRFTVWRSYNFDVESKNNDSYLVKAKSNKKVS